MSSIGPLGSKMCEDIVTEFYACRRAYGVTGMIVGNCGELLRNMNTCLDRESELRRRENAIQAKERRAKYEALLEEQKTDK